MSNYAAVAAEAGDKYLATLAEGQERIIEYVRASREFMPAMMMSEVPQPAFTPYNVPSFKDVANMQFAFANKLLEQQHKFFERLYGLSTPKRASAAKPKRPAAARTARKKKTGKSAASSTKTAS